MNDWPNIFKDAIEKERQPLPEGDWEVMDDLLNSHIRRRNNRRIVVFLIPAFVVIAYGVFLFVITGGHSFDDASRIAVKEQYQNPVMAMESADTSCTDQVLRISFSNAPKMVSEPKKGEERIVEEDVKEDEVETSVPNKETNHTGKVDQEFNWPQVSALTSSEKNRLEFRLGSSLLLGNTLSSGAKTVMMSPFDIPRQFLSSSDPHPLSYRHSPPITIGLSVSYYLTDRLLVTTGLDYSVCFSRVTLSDNSEENQNAHYLGLPLHLDWVPVRTNKVNLYIGVGSKVSKCIYAELGSRNLRDANLYCSAIGLAGLTYEPIRNVGLFVEPQLSFNLTSKAPEIHSAIVDSRTLFSFKAGVGISLK